MGLPCSRRKYAKPFLCKKKAVIAAVVKAKHVVVLVSRIFVAFLFCIFYHLRPILAFSPKLMHFCSVYKIGAGKEVAKSKVGIIAIKTIHYLVPKCTKECKMPN